MPIAVVVDVRMLLLGLKFEHEGIDIYPKYDGNVFLGHCEVVGHSFCLGANLFSTLAEDQREGLLIQSLRMYFYSRRR